MLIAEFWSRFIYRLYYYYMNMWEQKTGPHVTLLTTNLQSSRSVNCVIVNMAGRAAVWIKTGSENPYCSGIKVSHCFARMWEALWIWDWGAHNYFIWGGCVFVATVSIANLHSKTEELWNSGIYWPLDICMLTRRILLCVRRMRLAWSLCSKSHFTGPWGITEKIVIERQPNWDY